MSIFSGEQQKGAMKLHRINKRKQAIARNKASQAYYYEFCGHVHGMDSKYNCVFERLNLQNEV